MQLTFCNWDCYDYKVFAGELFIFIYALDKEAKVLLKHAQSTFWFNFCLLRNQSATFLLINFDLINIKNTKMLLIGSMFFFCFRDKCFSIDYTLWNSSWSIFSNFNKSGSWFLWHLKFIKFLWFHISPLKYIKEDENTRSKRDTT